MTRRERFLLAGGLAMAAALFYCLNLITPLYADDYSYSYTFAADTEKYRIGTLHDIWLSQLNHYQVINGRAIVHSLVQLLLIWDRSVFNVVNTLAFLALGFAVYFAAYGSFRQLRAAPLFAVYILLWLSMPGFGQSCLWLTGSVNYMFTALGVLLFLMPYRSDSPEGRHGALKAALMLPAGLLAGWSSEAVCLAGLAAAVLLCARRAALGGKLRFWMFTGLLGMLCGAALLFLAPGQSVRSDGMGGLGNLSVWLSRIPGVTRDAVKYLALPGALGLMLLAVSVYRSRGDGVLGWLRRYYAALVWLCAALISAYAMCAAPYFPLRAWCAPAVFAAAAVLSAFAAAPLPPIPRRLKCAAAALVCAACLWTYSTAVRDISATAAANGARLESIASQKASGQGEIVLEPLTGHTRWNCYPPEGDLNDDPDVWPNTALAMYFGVERVLKAD